METQVSKSGLGLSARRCAFRIQSSLGLLRPLYAACTPLIAGSLSRLAEWISAPAALNEYSSAVMAQPGVYNVVIPPQRGRQLRNERRVGILLEFRNVGYQTSDFTSGDLDEV
jgi:hypothetical protein